MPSENKRLCIAFRTLSEVKTANSPDWYFSILSLSLVDWSSRAEFKCTASYVERASVLYFCR